MTNDIGYLETSALNGTNIDAAFLTIINCKYIFTLDRLHSLFRLVFFRNLPIINNGRS